MELTPRKQKILSAIIELYTVSGEPVGSKVLCDSLDFSVSSATVRNEMSDLAAMGLLDQPHTSAGRVPSEKGYRVYLDELMQPAAVTPEERHFIDALLLPSAYDPEKLLDGVARILAGVSHMAAITTTPSGSAASVAGVQFVQTSRRTAMLILMTTSGTMHSRVFHCDFELSPEILRVFFRVFNEDLAGRPVRSITPAYIQTMGAAMGEAALLMSSALMALQDVAREAMGSDVRMDGQTNLLFFPELGAQDLRRMMRWLSQPQQVYQLLRGAGSRVYLGSESGVPALRGTGMIVAHYAVRAQDAGSIAVLGPMRMDYPKLLGSVDYLSRSVGRMLTELMDLQ
ncbi:MAG: heat-inducible transcriptional repressor HrcA [Oscillospiraceae bacterium]|jgi:heat-inducible transcriptional repressor|nr:heat-inducible transcriptional repressor HrcA [Oscillospiraceae bacterium]MDD3260293.1 heat-inducible transcriptional repressor HrcA [Oscillospiraceae bacterium]